ncbi:MAG: hypothetical protein GYB39_11225 [Algicola sp.]|nr:hypothetical protein [Algicola sp.]
MYKHISSIKRKALANYLFRMKRIGAGDSCQAEGGFLPIEASSDIGDSSQR